MKSSSLLLTELPNCDIESTGWDCCLLKAVLSSNPSSTPDFVVLVIFGELRDAAFFKAGDKAWTGIEQNGQLQTFKDAVFYNHKFYLVDDIGKAMAFDVGHPCPSLTEVALPPTEGDVWYKRYLVESLGELLQVKKVIRWHETDFCRYHFIEKRTYRTSRFIVYKLDLAEGKWVIVKSTGDQMLFLGENSPLSLSASDFPGCKPNYIYFTDDNNEAYLSERGAHDFGVFYLRNGTIEPLLYPRDPEQFIMPPPVWVLPEL